MIPTQLRQRLLCLLLSILPLAMVNAKDDGGPRPEVLTASFLSAHPDIDHRIKGLVALEEGKDALAFLEFQRAARYADKPSQAMVADMLWEGRGVPRDQALAYVWMDLAAERMYRTFVIKRERYWNALSEALRGQAMALGDGVYAEFGDDVAKPRLAKKLRNTRLKITGSRVGSIGALTIYVPGPSRWIPIDAETYYADRYWRPDDYFRWQDEIWSAPVSGTVEVGSPQTTNEAPLQP